MPDAPVNLDATFATLLVTLGRRAPRGPDGTMRRVVVRFDPAEIERLDALRARLPRSSRASIIRAFCLLGAGLAREHLDAKGTTP
jgi:hypothetical protein